MTNLNFDSDFSGLFLKQYFEELFRSDPNFLFLFSVSNYKEIIIQNLNLLTYTVINHRFIHGNKGAQW